MEYTNEQKQYFLDLVKAKTVDEVIEDIKDTFVDPAWNRSSNPNWNANDKKDLLLGYAATMQEVAEDLEHPDSQKFKTLADELKKTSNANEFSGYSEQIREMYEAYDVGTWNGYFRTNPAQALSDFTAQKQGLTQELNSKILQSFSNILDEDEQKKEGERKFSQEIRTQLNEIIAGPGEAPKQEEQKKAEGQPNLQQTQAQQQRQSMAAQPIAEQDRLTFTTQIDRSGSIDPDGITRKVRTSIIEGQRSLIANALANQPGVNPAEIETLEKYREFITKPENQAKVEAVLSNPLIKQAVEKAEIAGYQEINKGMQTMEWKDTATKQSTNEIFVRAQVVKGDEGQEIATLEETTHKLAGTPKTVTNSAGQAVNISSYRTVEIPAKIDEGNNMHLSLVLKDENGKAPPASKAVYFTAHYEDGKLVEMSYPTPVKFAGDDDKAMGYVEHGGKIYTLPVTRGKFNELKRELDINKGQEQGEELGSDTHLGGKVDKRASQTIGNEPVLPQEEEQHFPPPPPPLPPAPGQVAGNNKGEKGAPLGGETFENELQKQTKKVRSGIDAAGERAGEYIDNKVGQKVGPQPTEFEKELAKKAESIRSALATKSVDDSLAEAKQTTKKELAELFTNDGQSIEARLSSIKEVKGQDGLLEIEGKQYSKHTVIEGLKELNKNSDIKTKKLITEKISTLQKENGKGLNPKSNFTGVKKPGGWVH